MPRKIYSPSPRYSYFSSHMRNVALYFDRRIINIRIISLVSNILIQNMLQFYWWFSNSSYSQISSKATWNFLIYIPFKFLEAYLSVPLKVKIQFFVLDFFKDWFEYMCRFMGLCVCVCVDLPLVWSAVHTQVWWSFTSTLVNGDTDDTNMNHHNRQGILPINIADVIMIMTSSFMIITIITSLEGSV